MSRNLPNLLTILRLILTPCVAWAIWTGQFRTALWWVFIAGATDAFDGFLARRFRSSSKLGAYLDPVADKFLLVSSYVALGLRGVVPRWLLWLVLGRDVLILAMVGIAFLFTTVRGFPPSMLGKISTVCQVLTALILLAAQAYPNIINRSIEELLIVLTAAFTAASGLHYTWRAIRQFPAARGIQPG